MNLLEQISSSNNLTTYSLGDVDQLPRYADDSEAKVEVIEKPIITRNTHDHLTTNYLTALANLSQNITDTKLIPVCGTIKEFGNYSGWSFELLNVYLDFIKVPYNKNVFHYDFYLACFEPYFKLADIYFDWIKEAYCPDTKYGDNTGFQAMYLFFTSEKLQNYYNGYNFSNKPSSRGTGFNGYIKDLLRKNPISSTNLRKLEEKFENMGIGLEIAVDKNFHQLSESRQHFYRSHTKLKKTILAQNIYKYLKNNQYILQNNLVLNDVIVSYESSGADSFYAFIQQNLKEIIFKSRISNYSYTCTSIEAESRELCNYIENVLTAIYWLFNSSRAFYSLSQHNNN